MDQKQLRALEFKCIQEEPAECVATCPLHVDARTFVGLTSRGQWDEAWKILRKTMPFPGIPGPALRWSLPEQVSARPGR